MSRENIGRRIRSWLVDAGMSVEELADKLSTPDKEVKPGTVKSWLYGSRGMSFETAVQIADVFGKPLDELACRDMQKAS